MARAMSVRKLKQYDAISKAIRDLIAETRLAYQFSPGSYTMSAFNAALALDQVYARDAVPVEAPPDWIAMYLEHQTESIDG
jgi:hypothetical protein